jgi:hypothetical protein
VKQVGDERGRFDKQLEDLAQKNLELNQRLNFSSKEIEGLIKENIELRKNTKNEVM